MKGIFWNANGFRDPAKHRFDALDKKAEHTLLSQVEMDYKNILKNRLVGMLREEELKWYERAKAKNLLQGDANTQYFHLLANGRHRKTRIFKLQDGNNVIEGDENLKRHITSYYKDLFGPPEASHITLDDSIRGDIPQVSVEENQRLTDRFSAEEVKAALFQMEKTRPQALMGFQLSFGRCSGKSLRRI
jgi:hypothetical protein